jgi:hypothetical protein
MGHNEQVITAAENTNMLTAIYAVKSMSDITYFNMAARHFLS